jgi:predicted dehydrogenase
MGLDRSRFIGAYDVSYERARAFAQRYGGRAYAGLSEMLSCPDVQMASICSPHATHPEMVLACASAGVHALLEKPMAVDLIGCDLAIQAAGSRDQLGVISQRRFYEPVRRAAMIGAKIGAQCASADGVAQQAYRGSGAAEATYDMACC